MTTSTWRRWWRTGLVLAMVTGAGWLTGCQTVPFTGRSQLVMTSRAEEAELGRQAWQEISAKEPRANSAVQANAVTRVGQAIAEVADAPDFQWEFRAFENVEPNAFCLPGGKVAVYSGLFRYTANDAELAAVVGHEIAHAIARHGGERMSQAMIQAAGALALGEVVGPQNREVWLLAYGGLSNLGVMLPYSRTQEYESDQIGMALMAEAGYDPRAGLSFWEKFTKIGQSGTMGKALSYLSTHPFGENRLAKMRDQLPVAMELYQRAPRKRGLGEVYAPVAKR